MSVIFCDKTGRAVLWAAEDNTRLIDERGKTHGFVEGPHVFDLHGEHKGWNVDGLMRDMNGRVVAFWSGTTGIPPTCPVLPIPFTPFPNTPVSEVCPTLPARGMTHIQPQFHIEWSPISPLEWLN